MSSAPFAPRSSLVHVMLALTVATGAIVRVEPAPYDLLMVLTLGLGPWLLWPSARASLLLPGVLAALLLLANGISLVLTPALGHSLRFFGVTAYLMVSAALVVGWLERGGTPLLRTLLHAYAVAALLGGGVAIAAYFGLIPGASLMLPKGRLQGLFKDANVFGAFMAPAVVLGVARLTDAGEGRLRWATVVGVGLVGVLLSYSRGAWINLAIGLLAYACLRLVSGRVRPTLGTVLGVGIALALVGALLVVVFDHPAVREMLTLRASAQDYDDDRFANQAAAMAMAWDHPWGIGPGATESHFPISAHSLYVRAFVENGRLGLWATVGLLVASQLRAIGATLWAEDPQVQRLMAVVAATLAAVVVESAVIDTVHWRHLWLLLALAWAPRGGSPVREASPCVGSRSSTSRVHRGKSGTSPTTAGVSSSPIVSRFP
ncbi:MAG: O-antigen ligase family protein [Myxococcota bacterium]